MWLTWKLAQWVLIAIGAPLFIAGAWLVDWADDCREKSEAAS